MPTGWAEGFRPFRPENGRIGEGSDFGFAVGGCGPEGAKLYDCAASRLGESLAV